MSFINWGHETPEQKEMRRRFEEQEAIRQMMARKMFEAQKISEQSASSISGAGPGSFGVTVQGSIITGAVVKIGWEQNTSYVNSEGNTIVLDESQLGTEYATTDSTGVANFTKFNPQWVLYDYSTGNLIKRYAPIYAVGGGADLGYTPAPMSSNVSVNHVNQITTILSSAPNLIADTSFKDYSEWESTLNIFSELLEYEFSEEDSDRIKRDGYVPTDAYQSLITPIRKAEYLLESAGVENDTILDSDIEFAGTSRTALALSLTLGQVDLNEYFALRKAGEVEANTIKQLVSQNLPTSSRLSILLVDYTIGSTDFIADVVEKLYDDTSDVAVFDTLFETYSADVYPGDGGGVKPPADNIVSIIEADPYTGYFKFKVTGDSIIGSTVKLSSTNDGWTPAITLVLSDSGNNTYDFTVSPWSETPDDTYGEQTFRIEADLTTNRLQNSQDVIYVVGPDDTSAFQSVLDGSVLPGTTVHPKPKTGQLRVFDDQDRQLFVADANLPDKIFNINYWTASYDWFGNGEESVYIYYNGANWVIDNDGTPKEIIAVGPKDIGKPTGVFANANSGQYSEVSKYFLVTEF
jgi:hypothetical protein